MERDPLKNNETDGRKDEAPVLSVENLVVDMERSSGMFGRRRTVRILCGVSLSVRRGRTLGLVGESGCGKTTLARAILGLVKPTSGRILFRGRELSCPAEVREARRRIGLVFQDPYSSLNPRMTISQAIAEPLKVNSGLSGSEIRARVGGLLETVGLGGDFAVRYPHELSGGQRQRVAIARALALEPELVIADEPVSCLDVSIQAQILNLFRELQGRLGLACIFISHNLAVIRHVSDDVAVMREGGIVESGPVDSILGSPGHEYTKLLLSAQSASAVSCR
jgi:oligopeptide transport system ATP-binding protein